MTNEELSNEGLLNVFKEAILGLQVGGTHANVFYFEIKEEVLSRMKEVE